MCLCDCVFVSLCVLCLSVKFKCVRPRLSVFCSSMYVCMYSYPCVFLFVPVSLSVPAPVFVSLSLSVPAPVFVSFV